MSDSLSTRETYGVPPGVLRAVQTSQAAVAFAASGWAAQEFWRQVQPAHEAAQAVSRAAAAVMQGFDTAVAESQTLQEFARQSRDCLLQQLAMSPGRCKPEHLACARLATAMPKAGNRSVRRSRYLEIGSKRHDRDEAMVRAADARGMLDRVCRVMYGRSVLLAFYAVPARPADDDPDAVDVVAATRAADSLDVPSDTDRPPVDTRIRILRAVLLRAVQTSAPPRRLAGLGGDPATVTLAA